jgi:two-component system, chemotaxis family, chemotaxis protein CheY
LLTHMKEDELLAVIPVVVVSTEGSVQMIDEFMAKGAAGYIQKPFTPENIREMLNKILGDTEDGQGSDERSDEDLDF